LTVTDIATGWTINRSVRNKAQLWVFQALAHALGCFPFPILGIDSDNGSEFINAHLLAYCIDHQITFTRSRPGHSNDGAHVEQKNWARVRELVGYYRYDTAAELAKLNEIWELDALFTNYLLPQQKLIFKQRNGAKVTKRYDTAATPHQRAVAHTGLRKRPIITMNATLKRLKPAALSRQILALTGQLEILAQAKKAPRSKLPSTAPGTIKAGGGNQMRQRHSLPGGIDMRQRGTRSKCPRTPEGRCEMVGSRVVRSRAVPPPVGYPGTATRQKSPIPVPERDARSPAAGWCIRGSCCRAACWAPMWRGI
jgi:hypothetical protein